MVKNYHTNDLRTQALRETTAYWQSTKIVSSETSQEPHVPMKSRFADIQCRTGIYLTDRDSVTVPLKDATFSEHERGTRTFLPPGR